LQTHIHELIMKYSLLDGTGLVVSRLGFGAMGLGQGTLVAGIQNRIDQAAANSMVARALDAGINLFDTADAYMGGVSEVMLGSALKGAREKALIATKVGFRCGPGLLDAGLSYRRVIAACDASLKRLDTDWIDLYQLHIPDPVTPSDETLRALDHLVRAGKVRHVGVSNYPAWKVAEMATQQKFSGGARIVSAQMYHSLLGRDIEHEFVPMAEANKIGLIVWSPLASGFLTGKYTRENPVPDDARRNTFAFPPVEVERGYDVIDALRRIAARHAATPAQVALAWLMDKPYVTSVLVGASTPAQFEANLGALGVELAGDELAELDELTRPAAQYPGWMQGMGWDAQVREALAA
jgi:aryl-alcohol dehydrogenase-like predicted oxidoreductase